MTAGRARTSPRSQWGGILSSLLSLVFLAVFCATVYLARHPILRFVGESWIVEDSLAKADAILVLSDDNFYADRATRAAEVYRQGLAPVVVASGRRLRPYAGVAELIEHDLIERGVPKEKIVRVAHDAANTREEAVALAQFCIEKKWRSVIVVTSNYHTRRARYIFDRVFPANITVRVTGSRDLDFDPDMWWQKRIGVKKLTREIAAMAVALWELHGSSHVAAALPAVVGRLWPSPLPVV